MERSLGPVLVLLLVASAGCLGGATGPLHPPSGPADERVETRQPGGDGTGGTGDIGGPGGGFGDQGTTTPQAVQIPTFDFREGDEGNVVVELTVENAAAESRTVTLVAALEVNGTIEEAATEATLGPGERTTIDVHFDGDWDDFTPNLAYARVQPSG